MSTPFLTKSFLTALKPTAVGILPPLHWPHFCCFASPASCLPCILDAFSMDGTILLGLTKQSLLHMHLICTYVLLDPSRSALSLFLLNKPRLCVRAAYLRWGCYLVQSCQTKTIALKRQRQRTLGMCQQSASIATRSGWDVGCNMLSSTVVFRKVCQGCLLEQNS